MTKSLHKILCEQGYQPMTRAELRVMQSGTFGRYVKEVLEKTIESFIVIPENLVPEVDFNKGDNGYLIYIRYQSQVPKK